MKQNKDRGVIIMDKSKYKEKCLMVLENGNFKTLGHDPTKKMRKKYNEFYENEKQIIPTRILMFISKWFLSLQVLWNSESAQNI